METFSIVIPVFNSEQIIEKTVEQIMAVAGEFNLSFEIILVNDSSPDRCWEILSALALKYENIKAINLLKNYGQHTAILAGLSYATGDFAITMDDDQQNPPREIIKLIKCIKDTGGDLVIGKFTEKRHSMYRRFGTKIVRYLNIKIFNLPEHIILSNFRIIRRDLVDRVLQHKTVYPYITGMLLSYATHIANVEVTHSKRPNGKSNYNLARILSLVSRLLINYSSYPLRLISSIGLVVSFISFLFGSYYLMNGIIHGSTVLGWTTLVVLISFLSGFIIALLGLIGEYLSRILDHLSLTSSFIIKDILE